MSGKTYPLKCAIRAQDGGVTRVDVYDDIGPGGWFSDGLTAKDFTAKMAGVAGPVECHINSGGGDVFDGIAIANALRAHQGGVTVVVDGLAASIASVIAQAGSARVMQANSMMMIHDAFGMAMGNAAEMRQMADTLDKVSNNIADVYATRSGQGDAASWRDTMKGEAWYTADEAVSAGLADRVGDEAAALPAALDVAAFTALPRRIAAALRSMPRAAAAGSPDGEDAKDCPTCDGKGKIRGGNVKCPDCEGTGKAPAEGAEDRAGSRPGAAAPGDETPVCRTCEGRGTVKHPSTGQNTMQCPGCKGTGLYDPDQDGDGEPEDRAQRLLRDSAGLLLGIESMPITAKALPVHHTGTVDEPWDGPAAVKGMPADDTVLEYCNAWQSDEAAATPHKEGDHDADDVKGNYKFPHHERKSGPANVNACNNGLARLGAADIPGADRAGVEAHLRAHLKDAGDDGKGADDRAHSDISAAPALERYRAALKGATA